MVETKQIKNLVPHGWLPFPFLRIFLYHVSYVFERKQRMHVKGEIYLMQFSFHVVPNQKLLSQIHTYVFYTPTHIYILGEHI